MSAALKPRLTEDQYLARERHNDFRSEFYRGEMFAMAGASYEHTLVTSNIAGEARAQLKSGPCRVVSSDLRVKILASGLYTYPDVVIVCDEPEFADGVMDTLLNPHALVEVLSDSTEKYDRGEKFAQYRKIPSLKEFVLVAQDQTLVERYVRQPDDSWLLTAFAEPVGSADAGSKRVLTTTFEFSTLPVRIPFADIYLGVEFPAAPLR